MIIIKDNITYESLIDAIIFVEGEGWEHEDSHHAKHSIEYIKNEQQKKFIIKIGKLQDNMWIPNSKFQIYQTIARIWEVKMADLYPCQICQGKKDYFTNSSKGWVCVHHFSTKVDRYQRIEHIKKLGLQKLIQTG